MLTRPTNEMLVRAAWDAANNCISRFRHLIATLQKALTFITSAALQFRYVSDNAVTCYDCRPSTSVISPCKAHIVMTTSWRHIPPAWSGTNGYRLPQIASTYSGQAPALWHARSDRADDVVVIMIPVGLCCVPRSSAVSETTTFDLPFVEGGAVAIL